MAKSDKMKGMSRTAYGRRYGVYANQVTRWIKQGKVICHVDGSVNVVESDQLLASHRPRFGKKKTPPAPDMKVVWQQAKEGYPLPPEPTITEAEAAETDPRHFTAQDKDTADALLKMLRYRKEAGELIERRLAEATVFAFFRQERDAWLAWPDRVSSELSSMLQTDPRKTIIALKELVGRHLDELARSEPPPLDQTV